MNLLRGKTQIRNGTVVRDNLNIVDTGDSLLRRIIAGSGISLASTGIDPGTGDVTVTVSGEFGISLQNLADTLNYGAVLFGDRTDVTGVDNVAVSGSVTTHLGDYASKTNIIDENESTFCVGPSQFAFDYFQIDLGSMLTLKAIKCVHNSTYFSISYSTDGVTWTGLATNTPASGDIFVFPYSISARYIKVDTYVYPAPDGWKVYEFYAYTDVSFTHSLGQTLPIVDGQVVQSVSGIPAWITPLPPSVDEGDDLQIGGASSYPTTSHVVFGDGYVYLYEKYDDCFAAYAGGDAVIAGWDSGYNNFVAQFGDIDNQDHGNYLIIDQTSARFNCTVSGTILTAGNGATGTFTTADSKTVTVVNGIITSIV